MRNRFSGGLDLVTAILISGGAVMLAAALVAAVVWLSPPPLAAGVSEPVPVSSPGARPADALPPDHVAAVLSVGAGMGAVTAVRGGDHIDVLGYFSRPNGASENATRVVLRDVLVLSTDRLGDTLALTLAVSQADALLIGETQALGVRPFVTLPASTGAPDGPPPTFSDTDLAVRLTGSR